MSVDKKFNLMIKTRLKKLEPCTWRDLHDALKHLTVGMPDVASKLSAKLPPGMYNLYYYLLLGRCYVYFSTINQLT